MITINDNRGVSVDARRAELALKLFARGYVAVDGIDQIDVPIEIDGTGDMAGGINAGIDADLKNSDVGIGQMGFSQSRHGVWPEC